MLTLLLFATTTSVFSVHIGLIPNTMFIASINGQTFSNITCTQCTCTALMVFAVGWNCLTINKTCHLITNYSLTDIGLIPKVNTTFYFQQVPFEILSTTNEEMTTLTTITETTTIPTFSTSTASTTHTTAIAQNSIVSSFNVTSWGKNVWTQRTYLYWSTISKNVTLKFIFETNNKDGWYLDDVSVRDSSSVELIINGNFEGTPLTNGWTTGSLGSCGSDAGGTSNGCHFSSHCYHDLCDGEYIWISQSFAVIAANVYSISFWCYYYDEGSGGGSNPVRMNVTIN